MKLNEMNPRQRKAFINVVHASNHLVGGLENTCLDNPKDSEEYRNAYDLLHDHKRLVDMLYREATTAVYFEDGCCFNTAVVKRVLRDINFLGKEWIMERCERRITKMEREGFGC